MSGKNHSWGTFALKVADKVVRKRNFVLTTHICFTSAQQTE